MANKVRVYAAVIKEVLEEEEGIEDALERLAEEIAEVAEENARVIIPGLPPGIITVTADKDSRGLFFRVELDGGGKFSTYLAQKEDKEHAWFETAVAEVVGIEGLRVNYF